MKSFEIHRMQSECLPTGCHACLFEQWAKDVQSADHCYFHQTLHDDRGPPCHHFTHNFLNPISSLLAMGHQKFSWKCLHVGKFFIILSFIQINQQNLAKLCRSRVRINHVNFIRIAQGTRPLGVIILVKFQIFKFWGHKLLFFHIRYSF